MSAAQRNCTQKETSTTEARRRGENSKAKVKTPNTENTGELGRTWRAEEKPMRRLKKKLLRAWHESDWWQCSVAGGNGQTGGEWDCGLTTLYLSKLHLSDLPEKFIRPGRF